MSISFGNSSIFPSSLTVQITEAERRLQNQHRSVMMRGAMLSGTLQQRMTDPVLLLWAGSLGFLVGEFTQCQMLKPPKLDHSPDAGHSFFETALDLIKLATSIRNLLAALPGSPPSDSLADSVKVEEPPCYSQEIPCDKAGENQQDN